MALRHFCFKTHFLVSRSSSSAVAIAIKPLLICYIFSFVETNFLPPIVNYVLFLFLIKGMYNKKNAAHIFVF